jgi:dTDP-4-dehydrorhamnose reductase
MNVVEACMKRPIKVIYISSEYVFQGTQHSEDDRPNPLNVYGKTKAAAEYIISILPGYLIIRAPFIKQTYPEVFSDQYCSRYFLEDIVPKIWYNIVNNKTSEDIIHIANEYKSLYQLYKDKGIKAKPIKMSKEQKKIIPQYIGLIDNSL